MTITRKEYREMRQRIKINKQSGSYVVTYPATGHPGYSKEKVFSPAIGFNAYAKARTFAMNKAMKLAIRPPAELKTMTLKITGISPLICHNFRGWARYRKARYTVQGQTAENRET